ncbi:DUF397 domain-containing protein [Micromonospora sp. WMMD998]|uniref:DUF397 domain-containing protein n=1 Tax=Micromonospora sp. WMMD998 TaxID=3016092 RepID=UPI00249AC380|nr:DUF397 domain-containing protein [Micromonospora sp. WMMD998]WFE39945.1 DUF397 domain-containing protein [Micromonospora sp. WMMD998]
MADTATPTPWRKSSRSCQGNCVEVSMASPSVNVRDSKDPAGPVLRVSRDAWRSFLTRMPRSTPDRPSLGFDSSTVPGS